MELSSCSAERIVRAVYDDAATHKGLIALQSFNSYLAGRPFGPKQLTLFLASLEHFNRHVAAGISILAGRVVDALQADAPEDALDIAGTLLESARDEFGLAGTKNHRRLFYDFARYLHIEPSALRKSENAVPASRTLGRLLHEWYRTAPIPFALGAHLASELTSEQEFTGWLLAFSAIPEYGFAENPQACTYLSTHAKLEPGHLSDALRLASAFSELVPTSVDLIRDGSANYMNVYGEMFAELYESVSRL